MRQSKILLKLNFFISILIFFQNPVKSQDLTYKIVDTGQEICYDTLDMITPPNEGELYFGQDAQINTYQPSYQDNGDGTVSDLITGLMWQKDPDLNGDLIINSNDKLTFEEALAGADTLSLAGYNDWRLPSIKELYSLILFSGTDPSIPDPVDPIPFISTAYFDFAYGDTLSGERIIDAQYWSSTEYVGTTINNDPTTFGVNFADGRIKGYPSQWVGPPGQQTIMTSYVKYVRGNPDYGINSFIDNNDGTISDSASGLMWDKNDNGEAVSWTEALAWVQQKNDENYLGYNDWQLPNAKEMQSLIDYTRSPQTTASAAIDPIFNISSITDEGGNVNYPFFWTSTTHATSDGLGGAAAYISFGEALGWMEMPPNSGNFQLVDVHGAGAQRSDPKFGDPGDYPYGHGPQGDVIRINNYVRLLRYAVELNVEEDQFLNLRNNIKIYPNPVQNYCIVEAETNFKKLEIWNFIGQKVWGQNTSSYKTEINLTSLDPGIYFIQIFFDNQFITKKIILE